MHNTRSSQRKARRTSGTPILSPQKPPILRVRTPKPKAPKQCSHDAACTCGSDVRPSTASDYRLGAVPPGTVSEEFIAANLGLTGDELVYLICLAKTVKDAVVASVRDGEALQFSAATTQWRMVDEQGPVRWLTRTAKTLEEAGIFTFGHARDFDALDDTADWTMVAPADVDMHRGYVSLKRVVGRLWTCTSLVPFVMTILTLGIGPSPGLAAKLTNAGSRNAWPFLMYQAIKLGLGIVSSTKLGIWDRALAVQTRAQVAKLLASGSHADVRHADADLEQRLVAKLNEERDRAYAAEAALSRRIDRGKARAARTVDLIAVVDSKVRDERDRLAGLEMQVVTAAAARLTLENRLKTLDDDKSAEMRFTQLETYKTAVEGDFVEKRETDLHTIEARFIKMETQQELDRRRFVKLENLQVTDHHRLMTIQSQHETDRVAAADGFINITNVQESDRLAVTDRLLSIETQYQTDQVAVADGFIKIKDQQDNDRVAMADSLLNMDERLATMQSGISRQGTHIHSVLNAVTLQAGELHETRQIFTAQLNNLVSTMHSAPASAPIAQITSAASAPAPRLFLRMRNPPVEVDPDSEVFDKFAKIFVMGETTFRVAHHVVSALRTPFLVVLMGYSGAGKSYTMLAEDGVIAAIIASLPSPVNVTVSEISETTRPMADLQYPKQSISEILHTIESSRTTSQTPANVKSSRTHIMIYFENIAAGIVYGCLVDVCGAEESGHRAEGGGTKARSTAIAQENLSFRLMLMELAGEGKGGFTTRSKVSVFKHSSALNLAVGRFLKDVLGEPEIRVVACMDGEKMDQVGRVLSVLPDFG